MKKTILRVLSYILVAVIASTATFFVAAGSNDTTISKLDELSWLIQNRFVGEVDVKAMEDAAAEAMIESLDDRWSYYMSAERYLDYKDQMSNSYVGVGITISLREDGTGMEILKVEENGPAWEAGIRGGDVLIRVDGKSVVENGVDGTKVIVRGEEGTTVELTVLRQEQELTFTVERRKIQTVVASGQMLDDSIGLVTIVNFDDRCAEETFAAIEDLLGQGAKALIFDVRNNPGGYKSELVKILDYLLPEGPLFRSEYYNGATSVDDSDKKCLDISMAVLVNGNSYSAAEFFAAALAEYDTAIVVGEQTSGKGFFQNSFELSDGSAVAISVGKYTTPNGVSLEKIGITPDIPVAVDPETAAMIYSGMLPPLKDPQILAAMEALK